MCFGLKEWPSLVWKNEFVGGEELLLFWCGGLYFWCKIMPFLCVKESLFGVHVFSG